MNYDLAFISALLASRNLGDVTRTGFKARERLGVEAALCYKIIEGHYNKFNEVPSIEHFRELYPPYEHVEVKDTIGAIMDELNFRWVGQKVNEVLREVAEVNGKDPREAVRILNNSITELVVNSNSGTIYKIAGAGIEDTVDELLRVRAGGGILGIPWPWPLFNEETGGIRPGNFHYLYGRQKSKKTFLLLFLALFWAQECKRKVLFFTREMSTEVLNLRLLAFASGVEWDRLQKGKITDEESVILRDVGAKLAKLKNLIFVDVSGGLTEYQGAIEEHSPDIVIHDYFKAMADSDFPVRKPDQAVAATVDRGVELHTRNKIPYLWCGHANRTGENTQGKGGQEQAWSDHITRRCEIALRIILDNLSTPERLAVIVNEGRNVRKDFGITLNANLNREFGSVLEDNASWVEEEAEEPKKKKESKPLAESGTRNLNPPALSLVPATLTFRPKTEWKKV